MLKLSISNLLAPTKNLQNRFISSTIEIMFKGLAGWISKLFVVVFCVFIIVPNCFAETSQSSNYKFDESSIGSGGLIESSSANYKASDATGDLVVGDSASNNYQINTGSKTTNDPTLSFIINSSGADFGSFSATTATTTTATFSVMNYTSWGYVVQIVGESPSNGAHQIPAMATTGNSQVGKEQFGINLVANTSPISVGANPNNGQFGFGSAAPNYATSNKYRYVSGETIATAPKSSGVTTYTISYLVNVGDLTPGGKYSSNQTLIVTGTY